MNICNVFMADRFNGGKPRYDLVPTSGIEIAARVFEFGEAKYSSFNWLKGLKYRSLLCSLERHLVQLKRGIDIDPESELPVIGHLLANALMFAEYTQHPEYKVLDDRLHFEDIHKYLKSE